MTLDYMIITVRVGDKVLYHKRNKEEYGISIKEAKDDWLNNPYSHFMYIYNTGLVETANEPHHVGCLVSLLLGKFIHFDGERGTPVDSIPLLRLTRDKRLMVVDEKTKEVRYVNIREAPFGNRIIWNYGAMDLLSSMIDDIYIAEFINRLQSTISQQFMGSVFINKNINGQQVRVERSLTRISYDTTHRKFVLREYNDDYVRHIANMLLHSIAVLSENSSKGVIWEVVREDTPKLLISLGSPGVGKTYSKQMIAAESRMKDPINISYDDPLSFYDDVEIINNVAIDKYRIGLHGAIKALDPLSERIEEFIRGLAIKNKVDTILEQGIWVKNDVINVVSDYRNNLYKVYISYKTLDTKSRMDNMQHRFNETGRYGDYYYNMDYKLEEIRSTLKELGMNETTITVNGDTILLFQ